MDKAIIRSSALDKRLACPASLVLEPLCTPIDRGDGDEGTFAHWLVASRAIRELGAAPPEGGLPEPTVTEGYVYPPSALWFVDFCCRHIMERVPPDWSLMVEVGFESEFPRWIGTGHADIVAISPDGTQGFAADWKSVRIPVDAAECNWQVASYVSHMKLAWPSLTKVEFDIVQPYVSEEDGVERVSTVTIEGERLEALSGVIDRHVCHALDNRDQLNTGRKQCRFCNAALQCPALTSLRDSMKMTLTAEHIAAFKSTPDDAVLGDWVVTMRTLKRPTEDAEELLHARLDVVPEVVAGDGTRITRKTSKGGYEIANPAALMSRIWRYFFGREIEGEAAIMGDIFKPSMTALKDAISAHKGLKKTSKSGMSADTEFDAEFRPLVVQKDKRTLQFL